ncbi:MAG: signal peptidase II [Defluviitaleaceae bacterium]|nr:signal peptidase II [Defluviitaleaceae bacterium]
MDMKRKGAASIIMHIVFFVGSILLIAIDQFVKIWARSHLQPIASRTVIEGFFALTYVENDGMAFGLLSGYRWIFISLTVLIMVFVIYLYLKIPKDKIFLWIKIPMLFIFSGSIGNMIDRFLFGYVVDMFQFKFINFPVFNCADSFLVLGAIALAVSMLFIVKEPI